MRAVIHLHVSAGVAATVQAEKPLRPDGVRGADDDQRSAGGGRCTPVTYTTGWRLSSRARRSPVTEAPATGDPFALVLDDAHLRLLK